MTVRASCTEAPLHVLSYKLNDAFMLVQLSLSEHLESFLSELYCISFPLCIFVVKDTVCDTVLSASSLVYFFFCRVRRQFFNSWNLHKNFYSLVKFCHIVLNTCMNMSALVQFSLSFCLNTVVS